jgi:hypothetical protein
MTTDHPSALDAEFGFSDEDLLVADREILRALESRSVDHLKVLGFGENGVAIAYPTAAPTVAFKRMLGLESDAAADRSLDEIRAYVRSVEPHVAVAPTELRKIRSDNGLVARIMIQQLYPEEQLVEKILEHERPSPTHPIVVELREAVLAVSHDGRQGLDAQFTNFAWSGERLVFFDVGLPFMYDEDGRCVTDLSEFVLKLPTPLRGFADSHGRKVLSEVGGSVRGCFIWAGASLVHLGLDEWLEPAVEAFNEVLDEPLDTEILRRKAAEVRRGSRVFKNLMRVQRAWATKVRRQPYDAFIPMGFHGKLL